MNEEIIEILQQYKFEHIPEKQAVNELLGLFHVDLIKIIKNKKTVLL